MINKGKNKEKVLLVAGSWSNTSDPDTHVYGKRSGLADKVAAILMEHFENVVVLNGGRYDELEAILQETAKFDIVLWWANVANGLPKIRNVKEVAPFTMLINSKRNDGKYDFQELVQRTLAAKANLTFEFSKTADGIFNIRIFDPLGTVWYDGTDIEAAVTASIRRILFLRGMTRQRTTRSDTNKELVMSWYFDQFKQPEYRSEKTYSIPDEQVFVDVVKECAVMFQQFMPVSCKTERFIGNASMRPTLPTQVGRCGKGMPSFRKGDIIYVSKRNIDKKFITLDNFVPVYMDGDKLMYCGNDKPSVDTPVQVRLYNELPNIHYMLHSHCYIHDAEFTTTAIPCGAIEEFNEVMKIINANGLRDSDLIKINLLGHGSILMWNNMSQFHTNIEDSIPVLYYKRQLPEYISGYRKAEDK